MMLRSRRTLLTSLILFLLTSVAFPPRVGAQQSPTEQIISQAQPSDTPATLTIGNRSIVEFRASLMGRQPADRAAAARTLIDRVVEEQIGGPVTAANIGSGAVSISVGGRNVFTILQADVDPLLSETVAEKTSRATAALQQALDETAELRRPGRLVSAIAQSVAVTALVVLVLAVFQRLLRMANARMALSAERRLKSSQLGTAEFVHQSRLIDLLQRLMWSFGVALCLVIAYLWLAFVLRRFPYTRPIGETLRAMMLDQLGTVAAGIIASGPSLFTVLVIFLITKFAARLVGIFFSAVENGRIVVPWIHTETAGPTRKLVIIGLWLFAVAVAYPYLPGSNTDAFKGVSVFVGLIVSLGSSGLMNQVMSGFTVTYSRALRLNDYVKIGDVEGVVTAMDTLSVKVTTPYGEAVTIPNAVTVSQTVINYTRLASANQAFLWTTVGIGYETPWRQVQAMLFEAAKRTPLVRQDVQPLVRMTLLGDFAITYVLLVCPVDPLRRFLTLDQLHANILDVFNEYGVQIMTPAYMKDPAEPKVVPRDHWFNAPARKP